ncbi:Flagellar biosynthetic protein FlhB [Caloramator mitchellensis]|uniref:Flagellar biosynthetic protein FliR n=1 Tax=Caloramator mitchellensis TaxID=908809 RepID=A0A0R3K0X7_CALMK|nr:flagellar biosynthesis protein FlhB [Caloramator mitchellensis]KRQ87044.1 Flagellar biosynthetic protein FlhB [Caloramator mitchellensis]
MINDFLVFFLASVRIVAMIMTSPVFSVRQIPAMIKIGLSLILAILASAIINTSMAGVINNNFDLLFHIARELIIGISLGYVATLIFNAIRVSAQLMDFNIGFSMSQYFDPSTSSASTPLERFFNWFALIVFLSLNFHHIILSAILKSFEVVPLNNLAINSNLFLVIIDTFAKGFYIAMQLAAPVVIVVFITDFTLGLVNRAVPQINIFILGLPIKTLVGLFAVSTILPGLTHIYVKIFEGLSGDLIKIFNTFPVLMLMASEDKTEEPSAKKLQDARKKGQVAKSVDLNSSIVLLGVMLLFLIFGQSIYFKGRNFVIQSFEYITKYDLSISSTKVIMSFMLKNGAIVALPFVLTIMVLGVFANIVQTGFLLTGENIIPKFEKLNPANGLKRIFSKRSFLELVKSVLKISIIFYITFSFIKSKLPEILKTSDLNPYGIYPFVKDITDSQLSRLVIFLLVIGIADFIIQKRQLRKDLMMTKQEVKEELKQSEGDPQIKSRIRQKQREMAMRRMMHEVPKATVVVTNPTHFAVAIRYERNKDNAPVVVAKGADLIAKRIKEIAKENNVPVVENKILARTLYAKAELDQTIPIELYQAVAEIIAYVYSIKRM